MHRQRPRSGTASAPFSTHDLPHGGTAEVHLKRGRANPVWHGHPWIFSGAIERVLGDCEAGDVVSVRDAEGRLIGQGLYNPRSQIVVRMLTRGLIGAGRELETLGLPATPDADPPPRGRSEPRSVVEHLPPPSSLSAPRPAGADDATERALAQLIAQRIAEAAALRRRLGLPGADTTAYRLINSEGDGLPGLIVDVFGDTAAVQFTALGLKRREDAVLGALRDPATWAPVEPPRSIVEVSAGSFAQVEGFSVTARVLSGDPARLTTGALCLEHGVQLTVELSGGPGGGQKTGMFLDQRENRARLGRLCAGARVLDVYSYAGGFALQALRGGASAATCVDMSARALSRAAAHAEQNGLGPLETVEADAFRYLEGVTPYSYDVVVVDPPKFARAQKDLGPALKGYQRLNALALNAVRRGGLLATSSCSGLVDATAFERMLAAAAQDAGRRVTLLETASQGPDHPVPPGFPEGRYLKFFLLGVA